MATYPLNVLPPQSTVLENNFVTENELRHRPQDYFDGSDVVWVTLCGALVLQMIPAISMVYAGATDRSSTLTLLRMPVITAAFCTVQWYLWGYVLTFSPAPDPATWTWYGGHTDSMVLYRALVRPVGAPGSKIPELLYAFYQGMFAAFTPALVCGGVIKKFKVGRFLIFIWLWSLLVYYPVARWTWSVGGFGEQNDVMDFAGGTAVHITSGTAVGAIVLFHEFERHGLKIFSRAWAILSPPSADDDGPAEHFRDGNELSTLNVKVNGSSNPASPANAPRPDASGNGNASNIPNTHATAPTANGAAARGSMAPPPAVLPSENDPPLAADAPHSLNNLVLGTMLLWIGWLGFNGGSALGGNMRAVSACAATHVAASSGACVMLVLFWWLEWTARKWPRVFQDDRGGATDASRGHKLSVVQFCDGAVVGLVAITPAAGFVPIWAAGCIGAIASGSIFGLKILFQDLMRQDPLFIFLLHTGGGFIGMFFTGCFARQYIVGLDGFSELLERSVPERLRLQMADAFMGFGFTLGMTLAILFLMKLVLRPFTGTWRLLGENERDKLEAELEYKWRIE
ncbi:ammonium transporter AmtB-like domain-containing protein [Immersiella caudata]|uniref:Ammonium transporter AmtB-like domain-containing protein n=1 Tax=Immersiella caudata TaxID=314043 RepID=A0AA39XCM4_9PEZI|nr:ammonium transporter AmtB-like domain-containing protein [Immersiella caudata]